MQITHVSYKFNDVVSTFFFLLCRFFLIFLIFFFLLLCLTYFNASTVHRVSRNLTPTLTESIAFRMVIKSWNFRFISFWSPYFIWRFILVFVPCLFRQNDLFHGSMFAFLRHSKDNTYSRHLCEWLKKSQIGYISLLWCRQTSANDQTFSFHSNLFAHNTNDACDWLWYEKLKISIVCMYWMVSCLIYII